MNDKRREERKRVRVWIVNNSQSEFNVWFPGEKKDEDFKFLYPTVDLTKKGVFLESTYPLSVGSILEIQFEIDNEKKFTVKGKVVRVVDPEDADEKIKPGMGLEFIDLTEEQENLLDEFMKIYSIS